MQYNPQPYTHVPRHGKIDIYIYNESLNENSGYEKRCEPIWGLTDGLGEIEQISISDDANRIALFMRNNTSSVKFVILEYNEFANNGNGGYTQVTSIHTGSFTYSRGRNIVHHLSSDGKRVHLEGGHVFAYNKARRSWYKYIQEPIVRVGVRV